MQAILESHLYSFCIQTEINTPVQVVLYLALSNEFCHCQVKSGRVAFNEPVSIAHVLQQHE